MCFIMWQQYTIVHYTFHHAATQDPIVKYIFHHVATQNPGHGTKFVTLPSPVLLYEDY